jgi:hypothetical protein
MTGWISFLFGISEFIEPWTWRDSLDKQPKTGNIDMRFGTWNVRSLYRAGSLVAVSK